MKRFGKDRGALKRIIKARRDEKKKSRARAQHSHATCPEEDVRYYGDFRVSNWGVFARSADDQENAARERISTTRIDLLALTRDTRGDNWGTYVQVTNGDGGVRQMAIPHALTAADKATEISAMLASLGVGVVPSKFPGTSCSGSSPWK